MCAQAAGTDIGLAADPTTVRPSVGVYVHVVQKVMLELEVVVTDRAHVPGLLDAREPASECRAGLRRRALPGAEAVQRQGVGQHILT